MLIETLTQEIARYQSVIKNYEKAIEHAYSQVRLLESLLKNYQSQSEQLTVIVNPPPIYILNPVNEETIQDLDDVEEQEAIEDLDDVEEQEAIEDLDDVEEQRYENDQQVEVRKTPKPSKVTIEELRNVSFPLREPYKGMSKMDALRKIFNSDPSSAYEALFITQELYDNLEEKEFNLALRRIRSALVTGVSQGDWYRVKNQPGFYSKTR